MRFSEEKFARFVELAEDVQLTTKQIGIALGVPQREAARLLQFYWLHGRAETHAYLVEGRRVEHKPEELRSIAERLYLDNIWTERGAVLFKVEGKKRLALLHNLLEERKATGLPLAEPAPLPVSTAAGDAKSSKACETGESGEVGEEAPRTDGEAGLGEDFLITRTFGMPTAEAAPDPARPALPRFGRATAPIPSGRVSKKRGKEQDARKRKRRQRQERSAQTATTTVAARAHDGTQNGTIGDLIDEILGEFPAGMPARDYVPGKGRQPEIDIYSEGFEELPLETRIKAVAVGTPITGRPPHRKFRTCGFPASGSSAQCSPSASRFGEVVGLKSVKPCPTSGF